MSAFCVVLLDEPQGRHPPLSPKVIRRDRPTKLPGDSNRGYPFVNPGPIILPERLTLFKQKRPHATRSLPVSADVSLLPPPRPLRYRINSPIPRSSGHSDESTSLRTPDPVHFPSSGCCGGRLTITTGLIGEEVVIRMVDTGVGLPEPVDKVFEPASEPGREPAGFFQGRVEALVLESQ